MHFIANNINTIANYIFRHPEPLELLWNNVRYFDGRNHAPDIAGPAYQWREIMPFFLKHL